MDAVARLSWMPLSIAWVACSAPPPPSLPVPPRVPPAATGSELLARFTDLDLAARERELDTQVALGNLPPFLRVLQPVVVTATIDGVRREGRFWCTPDYLGFGTDQDWLRTPMTPPLAQRCADALGCVLPTRAMVDAIWRAASVHVEPVPFSPKDHDITSWALFGRHHAVVQGQLADAPLGALVAGCKKDIVVAVALGQRPRNVVIYGWHHRDGRPIQPLYAGHSFGHVDYSHGVRLVAKDMEVDGRATTVAAVLADPQLCALLSDEGPLSAARYPTW